MKRGEGFWKRGIAHTCFSKSSVCIFIEFLQKLQTHVKYTRTTIIRTFNHFIQQILRIPYEPGNGKTGISLALEFTFLMEEIHTFSPICLYIIKALDFYGIS